MNFETLHELVRTDPELAWPELLSYIAEHPTDPGSSDLIQDLIYEHDDRFVERLEAAALNIPAVRSAIEQAHVGGFATVGAERFGQLQQRLADGPNGRR